MKIRQHLVPTATARKVTSGTGNSKRKICIHETDNTRSGADADAHSRLQYNGNSRQASWHWQVDDKEAVQSFTHEYKCWAAGDGTGNNEAIHIEICVNSDSDYLKAVSNAVKLVRTIMKEENISIGNVVQHNYYSGKNCPRILRSGNKITWNEFLNLIKDYDTEGTDLTVSEAQKLQKQIDTIEKKLKELESTKATMNVDGPASDWAKGYYDWAVKQGITDGSNPRGTLTRQQGLTMLFRLYELIEKEFQKVEKK